MSIELREALAQIAEIRGQMARTEVFRGYRAAPVAITGVLAFAAAAAQYAFVPDPSRDVAAYLALWLGAAGLSLLVAGAGMVLRDRLAVSIWARRTTWMAVEQFLPCILAGGLATAALLKLDPAHVRLLPGLWQVFFALGIFASRLLLPKATLGVAAFYLACGLVVLGTGSASLSPWAMGLPFGVGQLLAAGVLYWNLEREREREPGDVQP